MRVTWLSVSDQLGGSEVALLEMVRAIRLLRPEWDLQVVVPGDGPLGDRVTAAGASCAVVPLPAALARIGESAAIRRRWSVASRAALGLRLCAGAAASPGYERRLRDVVSGFHPDVIHTNGLKAHIFAARLRLPGCAIVWHVHEYLDRRRLTRLLMRKYAPRCSAVVANSASVAKDVQAALGGSPAANVVYNTVDLDAFAPQGARLDLDVLAEWPAPPEGVVRVGLIATFGRWKGHDVFLRALSQVPPAMAVRGYIVGGPVYDTTGSQTTRAELEAQVDALGLRGRVGFTGFVEPGAAMRSLDVVVHASSEPEPFGLVVAEAMSCGRPVITTGHGGVAEIIEPGENVLVAPPGDDAALAAAICRLAENPALRQRLGVRARATALTRFERERMAADLVRIYESVRSRGPEARPA